MLFRSLTLNAIPTSNIPGIQIELYNIPKNCGFIEIYRRDCTENPDNAFDLLKSIYPPEGSSSTTIVDMTSLRSDRVYEYYAISYSNDVNSNLQPNGKKYSLVSNYALVKNRRLETQTIVVNLETVSGDIDLYGKPTLSFEIKTDVSQQENQNITESLKSQLGELYDQYLDPGSNSSSPLGTSKGIPNYADLFIHEIIRINLNTGERETFSLVTDGKFSDDSSTQSLNNVKSINPQHSYIYQVFTYRKNPIELDRKSTRLNSSHVSESRMPSSA